MSLKRIEKQRPCRADRNRPQSPLPSPLPSPQLLSPSPPSSAANDVAIGGGDCRLSLSPSLPINTSRSLPRSDSRFKSLQMQRKEESRLSGSGRHAGRDRGRHARPAGRRSFQLPRCCIASRHRRFTARLQTLASPRSPSPIGRAAALKFEAKARFQISLSESVLEKGGGDWMNGVGVGGKSTKTFGNDGI